MTALCSLLAGFEARFAQGAAQVLRAGKSVTVLLSRGVKTREVKPGERIDCRVAEDIRVDGCTVIPEGAPAIFEIMQARQAGFVGRPERLVLQAISTYSVSGELIYLDGTFAIEGEDRMVESLASSRVLLCFFFLVPGDRVAIAAGTGWVTHVKYDVPVKPCRGGSTIRPR